MQDESAIVYLDNAATSFPKPEQVYQKYDEVARHCCANPGRGGHRLAQRAAQHVLNARLAVARLFNIADCARVVFTANATEAINMALFGLLQPGDEVVTTSMEHNAVARPLFALQQRGVRVIKVAADSTGRVSAAAVRDACGRATKLVVMNHCSNVTGTLQPVAEVGPWCRDNGVFFMVDAAQSAGVFAIDVQQMAIDLLAAPGHKGLFGPQGSGFLYVAPSLELQPLIYGGTGTHSSSLEQPQELPERLESGTLNTPALAALAAGVEFVTRTGVERVCRHEQALVRQLRNALAAIPQIQMFGPKQVEGAVLSFVVRQRDSAEIAFLLDHHYNIAVRPGLHCSGDAHRSIGTFPHGTVRVSPGYFNTSADIDCLSRALTEIVRGTT